tara:strand:+ start:1091 stop:1615 length:525 start_codon:yes stop_codon:yes gene_type:complete
MTLKKIIQKCRKIKLIISDVDGVLTDGGMYYSKTGEVMKKFNAKDGMGVELLRKKIKFVLMTKERSQIVLKRAKKIKVDQVYTGIKNKELLLPKICVKYKISKNEIAYIGDDVNDFNIMKQIGLSAVPSDGNEKIKNISDYVCKTKGGDGAFRELVDLILSNYDFNRSMKQKRE